MYYKTKMSQAIFLCSSQLWGPLKEEYLDPNVKLFPCHDSARVLLLSSSGVGYTVITQTRDHSSPFPFTIRRKRRSLLPTGPQHSTVQHIKAQHSTARHDFSILQL